MGIAVSSADRHSGPHKYRAVSYFETSHRIGGAERIGNWPPSLGKLHPSGWVVDLSGVAICQRADCSCDQLQTAQGLCGARQVGDGQHDIRLLAAFSDAAITIIHINACSAEARPDLPELSRLVG